MAYHVHIFLIILDMHVVRFRKLNTKTQVTMIPGHVAWFYALGYCKIITMAIIVYELSIIAIVLIIILDNILPTYVCVCV